MSGGPGPSLAAEIAALYALLPQVEAVALSGSAAAGLADGRSDLDLYVYVRDPIPISGRARIAASRSDRAEVGNEFFEPGDEWVERDGGARVDVMFRTVAWIEERMDRVLRRHEASVGWSTCFWHNVLVSRALHDRAGWFRGLQDLARGPYPEGLRRAIVAKNLPLLRRNQSSFLRQIESAAERGDLVAVNHRVAAFLASWFDVLFAVNRLPHPGEKRLVEIAVARCGKVPGEVRRLVAELVGAAAEGGSRAPSAAEAMAVAIERIVIEEGLLPS